MSLHWTAFWKASRLSTAFRATCCGCQLYQRTARSCKETRAWLAVVLPQTVRQLPARFHVIVFPAAILIVLIFIRLSRGVKQPQELRPCTVRAQYSQPRDWQVLAKRRVG